MLLPELKELLIKYNEEDLRWIILQMYKSIPKRLREEKDIDELLQDASAYKKIGKIEKDKKKQIDIHSLEQKINLFLDYAYKQYYYAPNNLVHKKERPKWRFIVKAYIQDIQQISIESEEGNIATDLLIKLYNMLCYACDYYIFNTENPFQSVGIEQTSLLETIIARRFGKGISENNVKSVIDLVICSRVDRETLHSSLICILIMHLKSTDSKEIAIKQGKQLKKELQEFKKESPKKRYISESSDYEHNKKINNIVEMIFRINIELCEFDEAIQYFNKNYIEKYTEDKLYVLLRLIWEYELKDLWLREYDNALKNGVNPRRTLTDIYKYIQDNNSFPEDLYL
jgi:hypothetical protein